MSYPYHIEDDILGLLTEAEEEERGRLGERFEQARDLYLRQDFSAFKDLEELQILNAYGNISDWRWQWQELLRNSPRLHKLGLSLSTHMLDRYADDGPPEAYEHFFVHLCDSFGRSGCKPLKLRSLECGSGIFPSDEVSIKKLVDLAYLEEVRIDNQDITGEETDILTLYDDDGYSDIIFSTFLSDQCPRLRRFNVHDFRNDVFAAVCSTDAATIRPQLAFMWEQGAWDEAIRNGVQMMRSGTRNPSLPLRLRMGRIVLGYREFAKNRNPESHQLENLVATNASTMEGLAIDLLGGNLSNARPEVPRSVQMDILYDALSRLPHLRQLAISSAADIFGKPTYSVEFEEQMARDIAESVPQLRFLELTGNRWRISRIANPEGDISIQLEGGLYDPHQEFYCELFAALDRFRRDCSWEA